jgi:hypothetical protein
VVQAVAEGERLRVEHHAETPVVEDALQVLHGGREPVVVPGHQLAAASTGGLDHRGGVLDRFGQRLLAVDVSAGVECGDRDLAVLRLAGRDRDQVRPHLRQHPGQSDEQRDVEAACRRERAFGLRPDAEADELHAVGLAVGFGVVAAPAGPDHDRP